MPDCRFLKGEEYPEILHNRLTLRRTLRKLTLLSADKLQDAAIGRLFANDIFPANCMKRLYWNDVNSILECFEMSEASKEIQPE
jgi:hypothetical protein